MIDIFHAPEYSTRLVNMPFLKSSLCASLRSSRLLPLCSHVRLYVCHRPCSAGSSGAGSSSCSMQGSEQRISQDRSCTLLNGRRLPQSIIRVPTPPCKISSCTLTKQV